MARTFKRRRTLTPLSELNVTSLIDLGFSLLIIFMISTPLIENERTIPVELPVSTEAAGRDPDRRYVELVVTAEGYRLDGVLMNREQLEANLRVYGSSVTPPDIGLIADRSIQYQEVITVIDLLKQNDLTRLNLDTQSSR